MKLWQKISISCVLVLLLVVVACSTLLLINSRDTILAMSQEQARTEQHNLQMSFSNMSNYYLNDNDDPVVKKSVTKYCFEQFANQNSVLLKDSEEFYSAVSIEPQAWLPLGGDNNQAVWQGEIDGRNILIVGNTTLILSEKYSVYVVKDITSIYNDITNMLWRFVMICGIGIAAGTVLIVLIVRRASRPLISLREKTRKIANGEYSERSEVRTNDEIGELAVDFNMMAEAVEGHIAKLEDTTQRQKLFISGLTHEFKTPLTSMILHSETLLTTDLPKEDIDNALAHINTQCKWLESLTQKMLRMVTLGEKISKRKESVQELLKVVRASTLATLIKRGTPLEISCDTDTLEMDCDLIKSLLINLVDNASKASNLGQSVFMRAHGNTIEVADHGSGIPPEEIDKITDAFYMVDRSRSKLKGGSGLGLALVKQIADAHGAQLIIESEIGKGTVVKIIFSDNKNITF